MAKLVVFAALLLVCIMSVQGNDKPVAGGLGDSQPADEKVTGLVTSLKDQFQTKACAKLAGSSGQKAPTCKKAEKLEVLSYKTQTVAGTNYFVKVQDGDLIWHMRIFEQPWTSTLELTDITGPETKESQITYF